MNIENTLFPIPECKKNDDETKNYKGKPRLNIPIEKYKIRASTAEWVNATARNRGLQQFVVRGLETVTSMMIIFGLTHNMVRAWNLGLN